jgi:A/G-specific adenine glycosylase
MDFAEKLLSWYKQNGRHDLPWQVRGDPYPVWISEIMLQQTQVSTVIPYYQRFIARFPDTSSLAQAELDEVLHLWTGLGYYSRARNLHKTARIVEKDFGGRLPEEIDDLVSLPGIGRSTAGAILAQSFGHRHPILDGNVRRVLSRYHEVEGWPGQSKTEKKLWSLSEKHLPDHDLAEYTQAIMDLGATLCTRTNPACGQCPVSANCLAYKNDRVSSFPGRRPRKQLPVKQTTFLLLVNDNGEIYLQQRPPAGIWGGLWCLPETSAQIEGEWEFGTTGLAVVETGQRDVIRHTFSHFHLDMTIISAKLAGNQEARIMEGAAGVWYNPDNPPRLGLAAPVKKLIHATEVKDGEDG